MWMASGDCCFDGCVESRGRVGDPSLAASQAGLGMDFIVLREFRKGSWISRGSGKGNLRGNLRYDIIFTRMEIHDLDLMDGLEPGLPFPREDIRAGSVYPVHSGANGGHGYVNLRELQWHARIRLKL